jgi:hypothetical protein
MAIALAFGAGGGCSASAEGDPAMDQASSALSGDFHDTSGLITIRVKTCPFVSGELNAATCSVDTDFVLVGGGAEIVGNPNQTHTGSPGALLTASFPDANLTTWTAKSKDHVDVYTHQLRAYAIGLKLAGLTSAQLRGSMHFVGPINSGTSENPSAVAELPPGFQLIGGGARGNTQSGAGMLLTESWPDGIDWVARAKDHEVVDVGSVDAFAIGIANSIPGWNHQLVISPNSAFAIAPTGYAAPSIQTPTGSVLTAIGGLSEYDHNIGRLLTEMIPFTDSPSNSKQGAAVFSKDHDIVESGTTWAFILSATAN